jgi:hypothetical protein
VLHEPVLEPRPGGMGEEGGKVDHPVPHGHHPAVGVHVLHMARRPTAGPALEVGHRIGASRTHPVEIGLHADQLRVAALQEEVVGNRALQGLELGGVVVVGQPVARGGHRLAGPVQFVGGPAPSVQRRRPVPGQRRHHDPAVPQGRSGLEHGPGVGDVGQAHVGRRSPEPQAVQRDPEGGRVALEVTGELHLPVADAGDQGQGVLDAVGHEVPHRVELEADPVRGDGRGVPGPFRRPRRPPQSSRGQQPPGRPLQKPPPVHHSSPRCRRTSGGGGPQLGRGVFPT